MKTAITIVREAYEYTGVLQQGEQLNPEDCKEGLRFLNEMVRKWNEENYFPFSIVTADGTARNGRALIFKGSEDIDGEVPCIVNKVYYRDGEAWVEVDKVSYENIWGCKDKSANPTAYAFTHDEEMRGVIEIDAEGCDIPLRVIYNRVLPKLDYNDELKAPEIYEDLLIYGVAWKVAKRNKMPPEDVADIWNDAASILSSIKKMNAGKHKVGKTYQQVYVSPFQKVVRGYR
ncbi:MAG: hypothetical protein MJZ26_11515 [Fibrobacter sp.]|nr:hypothetical protein [Fibrobacter sp.]